MITDHESKDPPAAVTELMLEHYPLWWRGKVRDVFDAGDRLIFVATDRVSAFDVVLPDPIPGKGRVLTDICRFWFEATRRICANHVIAFDTGTLELNDVERAALDGRTIQVHKAERVDVECVVRARLAGSGWAEYQEGGTLAGESVPEGLSLGDPLPELRFTPATKNDAGHDENISRHQLASQIGSELANQLEQVSVTIFEYATEIALEAGFILADSKFEFGMIGGELTLIDEVLTPDSSRYWDRASLIPGEAPSGYDKQAIRDWLSSTGWTKEPPAPALPRDISQLAIQRYESVRERLQATRNPGTHEGTTAR